MTDPAEVVTPRMISAQLLRVFVAAGAALTSFFLLLSVVPLYAVTTGAGGGAAGLATGSLMFATVAGELVAHRLAAAVGPRSAFVAGLLLLGLPALALSMVDGLAAVLVCCVLRGFGFAITVVVGDTLVADLLPAERRGEGLGILGVVAGVPAVVVLPLGIFVADRAGYPAVFVAAGLVSLAGLSVVGKLPGRAPRSNRPTGLMACLRTGDLVRPSVVFLATAMAAGVVVTFLPIAVGHASGSVAMLALLLHALASTLTRWWAGRHGDRHGAARLLAPGVAVSALGVLAVALTDSSAAVVGGMVLLGAGFGITQNASLAVMFDSVSPREYGAVSALWNLAYDGGMGLGAVGFGVVAGFTGYPAAFVLTAVLVIAVVGTARRVTCDRDPGTWPAATTGCSEPVC